ncbi:uncharacterized protein [Hetaerina americana]|uniref:uncharacterized protein n=1 Tax=Hetaerina americana TaxID=62018 RepID=UPI003A7F3E83
MTETLSKRSGGEAFYPESKEFLQKVFWPSTTAKDSPREEDERVTVEEVEVEDGTGLGENYGSVMVFANVKIRTRKGLKDVGVVIKSLKQSQWHVEHMNIFTLFEKEVEFFNKTIPEIVKFQTERGVRNLLTEYVPKLLFAKAVGEEQIVITENMCRKGFRMADRHHGLGLEHSIMALETLGRFHAASLAMKILEPETFWKSSRNAVKEAFFTKERNFIFDRLYRQVAKGKIQSLVAAEVERGAEDAELLLRVSGVADRVIEQRGRLCVEVPRRYCEPLAVINHGDFWINNILYRYEKNEQGEEFPVTARLVDFQMTRYGSPSLDILTFLYTSTTYQLRKEHEEDLLRAYHKALLAGICEAGVNLDSSFKTLDSGIVNGNGKEQSRRQGNTDLPDGHPLSFRALKDDLTRHWPWGLMLAELMLPIVLGDASENENTIEDAMANSATTQNTEDDEEKVLGLEMLKKLISKSCDERYMEVIREFAHKGYLNNETI